MVINITGQALIINFSQWLYPWLGEIAIAIAIMATLLVIYGHSINRLVKKQTSGMHFIFRTLIFILLCTFGYGAVLIYVTPILSHLLAGVGMIYLGPLIVGIFITLGVVVEKG